MGMNRAVSPPRNHEPWKTQTVCALGLLVNPQHLKRKSWVTQLSAFLAATGTKGLKPWEAHGTAFNEWCWFLMQEIAGHPLVPKSALCFRQGPAEPVLTSCG